MWQKIKQELKQGKTLITFSFLQATGQILAMVVPLVVAKFFSPELFGSYSLAKMVVIFFATLLISSSQTPFIVFAGKERSKSGKINRAFSVQCIFLAASLCAFAVTVVLFNKQIIAFAGINRGDLAFVLAAFVGLGLKIFICNLFMAMGQRIKCSIAELLFGALMLSFVSVLYLTDAIGIRTLFLTYLVSSLLVVLIFVKTIDFDQLLPLGADKSHFKEMFHFTKWVMLGTTAVYFTNWGDNLVLRLYVSMGDIGTYNLAYQVFKGMIALSLIIYVYFLPFVSQHIHDRTKMRDYLYRKRPRIFLLGCLVIAVSLVIGPNIIRAIYGNTYASSSAILRILLVAVVPMLHVVLYAPILNALKKYRVTQTVTTLQVAVNVILNLVLVPKMGLTGAAVATVVAYCFQSVIIEIYFRLRLKKLLEL